MNDSFRKLLFLCTGNYYRSRFAEMLFNSRAEQQRLHWRAASRGLQLAASNEGPISVHTIDGLRARGVPVLEPPRLPIHVTETDLDTANHIVALKESEHRPLIKSHFEKWIDRVEFWHIDDVYDTLPEEALASIEADVEQLLARLQRSS